MIPKKTPAVLLTLFLVAIITTVAIVNHNNKKSEELNLVTYATSDNLSNFVLRDNIAYDTIKELAQNSDCIVVGEVVKKSNNSRNLAKDPQNPKVDAKDWKCMSQEYDFNVTQWLKGNGENNVSIVYPAYSELNSGAKIEQYSKPLEPDQKHVLFLKNGVEGTYYGAADPWQFKIVSGNVQVVSYEDVQIRDLKEMTEEYLLGLLNKYLSK